MRNGKQTAHNYVLCVSAVPQHAQCVRVNRENGSGAAGRHLLCLPTRISTLLQDITYIDDIYIIHWYYSQGAHVNR